MTIECEPNYDNVHHVNSYICNKNKNSNHDDNHDLNDIVSNPNMSIINEQQTQKSNNAPFVNHHTYSTRKIKNTAMMNSITSFLVFLLTKTSSKSTQSTPSFIKIIVMMKKYPWIISLLCIICSSIIPSPLLLRHEFHTTMSTNNSNMNLFTTIHVSAYQSIPTITSSPFIHKSKNTPHYASSHSHLFRPNFINPNNNNNNNKFQNIPKSTSKSTSTSLPMVLTTPACVIEQASTQILLDDLLNESLRTTARKPIIMQFDPRAGWIWRRWSGTVFSETWRTCIKNMLYALVISFLFRFNHSKFLENLAGFNILWGQLLSVTTFTLTFFLNQSYGLWRKCYDLSRRLQGRLNDLCMTMAAHAKRTDSEVGSAINNGDSSSGSSSSTDTIEYPTYTKEAREILELMSRYIRVFNLLTYASFTGSHRPILTPQGMRRLVERGLITEHERSILSDAQLPVTQRHNILLLWIMRLFIDARKAGHVEGGPGLESEFLEKCHVIRAQYGAIGDELQGRMPFAYAHVVQVLVDVILWMYPFMAFSTGMTGFLGVLGTALLTIFYQGLFDLAKQFLDPYDNESYGRGEDPLCIDTLIAESNAGSVRWMNGILKTPYFYNDLKAGNLQHLQLPSRGYSVEEALEREQLLLKEEMDNMEKEVEKNQQKQLMKQREEKRLELEQKNEIFLEEVDLEQKMEQAKKQRERQKRQLEIEMKLMNSSGVQGNSDTVVNNNESVTTQEIDECDPCNLDDGMSLEEALEKIDKCKDKVP